MKGEKRGKQREIRERGKEKNGQGKESHGLILFISTVLSTLQILTQLILIISLLKKREAKQRVSDLRT